MMQKTQMASMLTLIDEEEEKDIYDIAYNEPDNPSMFAKNVETLKEEKTKVSILEGIFEGNLFCSHILCTVTTGK